MYRDRRLQQGYHPELVDNLESEPSRRHNSALSLASLVPFASHPFKLYEGIRFNDMVESIKANGVISPIIVRSAGDRKYEILSGHNRVNAAKEAGLSDVPAIVWENLSDDEAKLIVTETNLIQRSFADMAHSERATVLSMHNEAMKKKSGYRSDLIEEIEKLTCDPLGTRLRTRDKISKRYGFGSTTVARYLRINRLIPELKERLDSDEFGTHVADALSFLEAGVQSEIESLLAAGTKICIEQAEALKKNHTNGTLSREVIEQILSQSPIKAKPIKLSKELFSQYFSENQTAEEIESVIAKALELYSRENK